LRLFKSFGSARSNAAEPPSVQLNGRLNLSSLCLIQVQNINLHS
jgi:hypothetical protein